MENEDALNVMFIVRQIFGIGIGLAAGLLKLQGLTIILLFFMLSFTFVYLYAEKYLGLDATKFEENELYIEAFGLSLMEFMLTWTMSYTFL